MELRLFRAIGDALSVLNERKYESKENKNMKNNFFYAFFCSLKCKNKKQKQKQKKTKTKTTFFLSKKNNFENMRNYKNKNYLLYQISFSIFCFQEHKIVLESNNQTDP